ncbi:phage tail assembly chaperone [Sphingomonas tabacisoli]|uniref:Phage tail assembly chaperone n=1 Tax=Sphingomonas tabacisoli TaxID=2249466 RepID=A0ABW4HZ97_9SPHN
MDACFAASASRLAGLAGAVLGWWPGEFWDATPAELAAVFSALNPAAEAPVGTDVLAHLQEQFPDG